MLSASAPLVLLLHGGLDNLSGKTGLAVLRYRPGPILAVVDPAHALSRSGGGHQQHQIQSGVSGNGREFFGFL